MVEKGQSLWPEKFAAQFRAGTFERMAKVQPFGESRVALVREAVDLLIAERERKMKLAAEQGAARSRERAKAEKKE